MYRSYSNASMLSYTRTQKMTKIVRALFVMIAAYIHTTYKLLVYQGIVCVVREYLWLLYVYIYTIIW